MERVVVRKDERIMTRLADEFEQLAAQLNSPAPITMEIGKFTQACRLVSPLIRHLGVASKFADIEYSAKVSVIEKAGKSVNTLEDSLDREIQQNTFKPHNSASRSLIRVRRSLEMLKIIFEQTMASSEKSIMDPVKTAYNQVLYPYHGWALRKTFVGALHTLPTKSLFFKRVKLDGKTIQARDLGLIGLTAHGSGSYRGRLQGWTSLVTQFVWYSILSEASAFVQMQRTVTALAPLIHYIDNLFHSRESTQELLRLI